ncbi:hypothetical protein IX329_001983 [Fusobacterium necrophorum]|nr:hypothetical protein [Fusobacterium necrophorum]MBR8790548.1 hypothetical protein [Fusobacterium necrophorum]
MKNKYNMTLEENIFVAKRNMVLKKNFSSSPFII